MHLGGRIAVLTLLLWAERSIGTAIGGGDKIRQCYWERSKAQALLLREERRFSNAIGGGREALALLLGLERSSGTSIEGGALLQQCYWWGKSYDTAIKGEATLRHWYSVRGNVLALLLQEERSFGTAIGGGALQHSYWGRRDSSAVLLEEERISGSAIGGGEKL